MTELFLKVKTQQEQNLPFVLYCKPNSDRMVGLFQKNDHLYFAESFEEKGFVFAAFDANTFPLIPLEHSDIHVEQNHFKHGALADSSASEIASKGNDFYEELVEKGIVAIDENLFSKVVISRKEEVDVPNFSLEHTLKSMISQYPTAFNYCFYHPKIGLWVGATPEQFLKIKDNEISTVALAGTQLITTSKTSAWGDKEKVEQQLVTDFIVDQLSPIVKELTISSPYTVKAGIVAHIKTDIAAKTKSKKALKTIIEALHPTPAVCGLPRQAAKAFILKNEGYNREYYAGFLGELNIDMALLKTQQSDLFVNLRCMKIKNGKATLFVGGGITKDSNPKEEYNETVNKSMTMKKVIR
jgi:isochorismate synthase